MGSRLSGPIPPFGGVTGQLAELTEFDICVKPLAWPSVSIKGLLRPRPLIRRRLESTSRRGWATEWKRHKNHSHDWKWGWLRVIVAAVRGSANLAVSAGRAIYDWRWRRSFLSRGAWSLELISGLLAGDSKTGDTAQTTLSLIIHTVRRLSDHSQPEALSDPSEASLFSLENGPTDVHCRLLSIRGTGPDHSQAFLYLHQKEDSLPWLCWNQECLERKQTLWSHVSPKHPLL